MRFHTPVDTLLTDIPIAIVLAEESIRRLFLETQATQLHAAASAGPLKEVIVQFLEGRVHILEANLA